MAKRKAGLPDFIKMKHDNHFVDEISRRTKTSVIRNIPISNISPNPQQPRKDLGDLNELVDSIKEKGVIEPIIVKPKDNKFEIIAGERRYQASKIAGLKEIPCIEYDVAENEALELSLIENIQRKDLTILEQANTIRDFEEIYGYTHEEIAKKIGKSRVTVTELIRIGNIPEEIQKICNDLKINSKSFLLQLAKLDNIDDMKKVLTQYKEKPITRDELREKSKTRELDKLNEKPIKFNFTTEDNKIRIKFNIIDKNLSKESLINTLEELIKKIKENKIKDLSKLLKE